jgi:hypothetical protein
MATFSEARANGTSVPSLPASGRSIEASVEVAYTDLVLHFGLLAHYRNGRLAVTDLARPVGISEGH